MSLDFSWIPQPTASFADAEAGEKRLLEAALESREGDQQEEVAAGPDWHDHRGKGRGLVRKMAAGWSRRI